MLPQQKKNYALQEHFLKASLWCIQGQIISLTIFHHWKCFFKSLVVPKIWYRVHQKKELWETVWIFYCTIAFSGMGPLKSSSNVMGRSILVHTSLSRNALSGAPPKFLFLLISHLSLSFPDFMDGLNQALSLLPFSQASVHPSWDKIYGFGEDEKQVEQQLLMTVILVWLCFQSSHAQLEIFFSKTCLEMQELGTCFQAVEEGSWKY